MLKIVQAPNSVLSAIAKPVSKIDKDLLLLIKNMEKALIAAKDPEGVGLAAPQVGKSLQLFIVKEAKNAPLLVFINPRLHISKNAKLLLPKQEKSEKEEIEDGVKLEGCLSLKDVWGVVGRYEKVELSFLDEHGKHYTKSFDGFLATIIQHEVDHLHGIIFPKRVLEQKSKLYKSKKNDKGETVFKEMAI
ncbi:MAG: peptide deformylase [Candidatus Levybacteria bacterium]|nr:peptide deformylase [Candidatus Levybacteria bacterium]